MLRLLARSDAEPASEYNMAFVDADLEEGQAVLSAFFLEGRLHFLLDTGLVRVVTPCGTSTSRAAAPTTQCAQDQHRQQTPQRLAPSTPTA